jgi:acetyl-CoA C-acetyltransferase
MSFSDPTVLVAGARTPFGRLLGGLKTKSAAELGSVAIAEAIKRAGIEAAAVDYVIMGQVVQAGAGQNPARQAAIGAGVPNHIPAITINKVCLSGIEAIAMADQLIRAGEFEVVVAGGMESMSNGPHYLPRSREGAKYGDWVLKDSVAVDALTCAFDQVAMGESTEAFNGKYSFTREHQDEFSVASHSRSHAANQAGRLSPEIVPVEVDLGRGKTAVVEFDEGIRPDTTFESLSKLRPAFSSGGLITAGNASQISDGAVAVVVMKKSRAEALGLEWLAEIGAAGNVAGPDTSLQEQPANAVNHALAREGLTVADVDLFELNEAFAVVGLVSADKLGAPHEKVNVNGGAIAIGHPVGASGARLVLHLAYELNRRGGGIGAAALCGGGGQGSALLLKVAK